MRMFRNRIVVNAIAVWGRGLLTLVLGIFSSRWALQAVGAEGYGLWALCCSVNFFACFAQGIVANATQRFLSIAVGDGSWRATYRRIVRVHFISASATLLVTAPISFWLIGNWLTVPAERVHECQLVMVWVFVFAYAAMINTPNRQLFAAHQRLVEPALWGIFLTLQAFGILAWMVTHPGRWLVPYAASLAGSVIMTEICLCLRARHLFAPGRPAADDVRAPAPASVGEILRFSFWRMFSDGGATLSSYGMTILVNRLFGAVETGAAGLARSAANQTNSLTFAVASAYEPALANEAGAKGELAGLTRRACLRLTGAYLLFAVPFFCLAERILALWLGDPPAGTVVAVRWLLIAGAFSAFGQAFMLAVAASGRVRALYLGCGLLQAGGVLLALGFFRAGVFGGGLGSVFSAVALANGLGAGWAVICYLRGRKAQAGAAVPMTEA